MANYKDLHGFEIKHRSSDPANPIKGEIWYNTTTQTLKVAPLIEAFSAGGSLPQGIGRGHCSGTQTAALMHHGALGGGDQPNDAKTFEYDGSSWTAGGDVSNMMRAMGGSGTQTDAMGFCGALNPRHPAFPPANNQLAESYNGTSWTAEANYPAVRTGITGCGAGQTATLAFGGDDASSTKTNETYEYNGTSWSEEGDMNYSSYALGGAGTSTAALKVGKVDGSPDANQAEEYDGSTWTNVNAQTLSRQNNFGTGGPQTAAYSAGGRVPSISLVMESYDGTNWTTRASLATTREVGGGAHTAPSETALAVGGTSPYTTSTEEFSSTVTVRSVDTS